jgi:tetratricopeptide (TPR) repeat protein
MLCFVLAAWRVLSRGVTASSDAWIHASLCVGWAAFLMDNFFSFTFIKPNIAVHGWAALAAVVASVRFSDQDQGQPWKKFPLRLGVVGFVFFILLAWLLWASTLCIAFGFYQYGREQLNVGQLNKAGQAFVQGSLLDRVSPAYPSAAAETAIKAYQATGKEYFLRMAETNYLEAARRSPMSYQYPFLLNQIYARLGDNEAALRYARQAERLSPFEYQRDSRMMRQQQAAQEAAQRAAQQAQKNPQAGSSKSVFQP